MSDGDVDLDAMLSSALDEALGEPDDGGGEGVEPEMDLDSMLDDVLSSTAAENGGSQTTPDGKQAAARFGLFGLLSRALCSASWWTVTCYVAPLDLTHGNRPAKYRKRRDL